MQKVITFCLSESCIQRKVGIEDNDMKIINKDIDSGKPFDWGKPLSIMRNSVTFIRKSFIKELLTVNYAWTDNLSLILEQERAFFLEICTRMGRSGRLRIFQKPN